MKQRSKGIYLWKLILIILIFSIIVVSIECFFWIKRTVQIYINGNQENYTATTLIESKIDEINDSAIVDENISKSTITPLEGVLSGETPETEIITTENANISEKESNSSVNDVSNEILYSSETGNYGYISSAVITETKTGVAPFDTVSSTNSSNSDGSITWTAGDDTSEDDNIVRSFDQITWTIENTLSLKNSEATSLTGGTIEVKATLPASLANLVKWDLGSMNWATNTVLSSDGTTFTADYKMSETSVTIPGKQTLVFVLKVLGAPNKTEIIPTFTLNLEGNTSSKAQTLIGETTYVSASPKYNVKLVRNTTLQNKLKVDLDNDGIDETTGRMYGYGVVIQLYNTNKSKGLKGIEYPTGNITFDINLKLERTLEGSSTTEDITDKCTPILWDYKINDLSNNGNLGRTMNLGFSHSRYAVSIPLGVASGRTYSVYNSGNISMEQIGNTIKTTVNGYEFDGTFPIYSYNNYVNNIYSISFTENIGCFSAGYFQILVPNNDESTKKDRSYYLTVSDSNFCCNSVSEIKTTKQQIENDDSNKVQHVIHKKGNYSQDYYLVDKDGKFYSSTKKAGDAFACRSEYIYLQCRTRMSLGNDEDIYTINKFVKFDGICVEPVLYKDGSKFFVNNPGGSMKFNIWYVTKQDGTNWSNTDEMNSATIENMKIYENMEDIPEEDICVGVYFESDNSNGNWGLSSGDINYIEIRLQIKDTSTIGQTYSFTGYTQYWIEALNRSIYTINNVDNFTYPDPEWDSRDSYGDYIKTEYDENGEIESGTHYLGSEWGNSILVVGGKLTISKETIDESGVGKKNYDFGKNEYDVTYKITPNLTTLAKETITGTTIKITDTIPTGMTYVTGSCDYEEPQITENSDGTTTLVWYLYDVSSDEALQTITYEAHLDETLGNGQQLESSIVIQEVPVADSEGNTTYLIGNTQITNRTYTTGIQIINLASYRLYKQAETEVIEKNGDIHFKISYKNNTDSKVADFAILDIMPYNGDSRGTSFNGTYTIDNIQITQNANGTVADNNNLSLYLSQDEQVKQATVKDTDLGTNSIWRKYEETDGSYEINLEQANNGVTGIAINGVIEGQTEVVVDIYAKTNNNISKDIYANSVSAQTQSATDAMVSSIVNSYVVNRIINGNVWFDTNYNSILDTDADGNIIENLGDMNPEDILISLYKVTDSGTEKVIDVEGKEIEAVHPDANGYYEFKDLPAANYVVKVEYDGQTYDLVLKNIGSDNRYNSKFETKSEGRNAIATTETITTLNSTALATIEESNVNIGLYNAINFEFTKVAEENNENGIGGTKFELYKLVCNDSSHTGEYHNDILIDPDDVNSCWELVGTKTSARIFAELIGKNNGNVKFENLITNVEYRLVETKASFNRMLPTGQWKIIFEEQDTGEYGYTITAVGENLPPAFKLDSNGKYLLPNTAYFVLPSSGSFGIKSLYTIAIIIVTSGVIIMILSKRKVIVSNKVKSTSSRKDKSKKSNNSKISRISKINEIDKTEKNKTNKSITNRKSNTNNTNKPSKNNATRSKRKK